MDIECVVGKCSSRLDTFMKMTAEAPVSSWCMARIV